MLPFGCVSAYCASRAVKPDCGRMYSTSSEVELSMWLLLLLLLLPPPGSEHAVKGWMENAWIPSDRKRTKKCWPTPQTAVVGMRTQMKPLDTRLTLALWPMPCSK